MFSFDFPVIFLQATSGWKSLDRKMAGNMNINKIWWERWRPKNFWRPWILCSEPIMRKHTYWKSWGLPIAFFHIEKSWENHRILLGNTKLLLSHSYGKFMKIIGLKAPGNYSASIWIYNFPICLWENPKNDHVFDFGTFGRVPEPQNHLFYPFETHGYLTKSRKSLEHSQTFEKADTEQSRRSAW